MLYSGPCYTPKSFLVSRISTVTVLSISAELKLLSLPPCADIPRQISSLANDFTLARCALRLLGCSLYSLATSLSNVLITLSSQRIIAIPQLRRNATHTKTHPPHQL